MTRLILAGTVLAIGMALAVPFAALCIAAHALSDLLGLLGKALDWIASRTLRGFRLLAEKVEGNQS